MTKINGWHDGKKVVILDNNTSGGKRRGKYRPSGSCGSGFKTHEHCYALFYVLHYLEPQIHCPPDPT
ncbi:hypothetical protein PCASD_02878 [Puccinia coronata f. sp. avenae]|uniref:Uncharacterized protein n=1 Tax=Puccinia coronata f. sp. avenae TaxID=200324 RepID=A0A2N5VE85_9BASI|nr:hypothetical protein PCASD_02878 [Puccinia coronata f. sp. avenae]